MRYVCPQFVNTLSSPVAIKFRVKGVGGIKATDDTVARVHHTCPYSTYRGSEPASQPPHNTTAIYFNYVLTCSDTRHLENQQNSTTLHKQMAATRPPGHESKRTHSELMTGNELRAGLGNSWLFHRAPRAYPP